MSLTWIKHTGRYLAFGFALSQILLSACSTGQIGANQPFGPSADYGDAPDQVHSQYPSGITANFPSRDSRNGAHHLDLSDSAFGALNKDGSLSVSAEDDAVDPFDSDGIQNLDEPTGRSDQDARDDGLLTTMIAPGVMGNLSFLVSVAASAPTQTRYVNILMDCNQDGEWSGMDSNGADEHPVQNLKVNVTPGTTQAITTPDFLGCVETNPIWIRMTLTTEPIDLAVFPQGWDGSGEFAKGETEDYLLRDHVALVLPDKTGGGGGGPFPPPPPPFPPIGGGGGGGGGGCEFWKSYSVTLCEGKTRAFLALVGGFAPDSVTAVSSNPSVASVEVNEANVIIQGNEEGETTIRLEVVEDGCAYHITLRIKVKKCDPAPKIDCCEKAQIAKDPSRCNNCRVVGWKIHTNETPAGGGSSLDGGISETGSHGDTSGSVSKSTVVTVHGNVIKIITNYYDCDPCPKEAIPGVDTDGDCIPDEEDWYPEVPYDTEAPSNFEEQIWVDRYFDADFSVNTIVDLFDAKYFEPCCEEGNEEYPEEYPYYYPYPEEGTTYLY